MASLPRTCRPVRGPRSRGRDLGTVEPAMPIYEYVCMSCESHFEELVRHDESPECPDCGGVKVQRQRSGFSASKAKPAATVKTGGGPANFGGCGHGSCGCH